MRALWSGGQSLDYLSDAFALLAGWTRDGREIRRTFRLDDCQHNALTERIKVVADALRLWPEIRRSDGTTQIRLGTPDSEHLTTNEVTFAARIEEAYRCITAG